MELGIAVGGWCPAGRRAEGGRIPAIYPLKETDSANYAVRTRYNVRDSDGTLILSTLPLSGGTALTLSLVRSQKKPGLVLDVEDPKNAARRFAEWLADNRIRVLNVAGPRGSTNPKLYQQSRELLRSLWQPLVRSPGAATDSAD